MVWTCIYHIFGWSNTKSLRNVTIFIILVDRMITLSYFTRFSRAILLNETVFNSDELILQALRWLNTVLRAVSGNSRDGECFNLDQEGVINSSARLSDVSGHRDVTPKWGVRRAEFSKMAVLLFFMWILWAYFFPWMKQQCGFSFHRGYHYLIFQRKR